MISTIRINSNIFDVSSFKKEKLCVIFKRIFPPQIPLKAVVRTNPVVGLAVKMLQSVFDGRSPLCYNKAEKKYRAADFKSRL